MVNNIPSQIRVISKNNLYKLQFGPYSTDWLGRDDYFLKRIDINNLNRVFLKDHLIKEFDVKNKFDSAVVLFQNKSYSKAIKLLDEILFYDSQYLDALLYKSYSLYHQKHFIKALRYFKKAVTVDSALNNNDFHKKLIECVEIEKENLPLFKLNIYQGDECFSAKNFKKAIMYYDLTLEGGFKIPKKICHKLLNKKATALLKLNKYKEALEIFKNSDSDYNVFSSALCRYKLGLSVGDEFKKPLKITKKQMLHQIMILNKVECFSEAISISNYLLKNHFKVDEFYFKLLKAKKYALEKTNKDLREIENIIDELSKNTN